MEQMNDQTTTTRSDEAPNSLRFQNALLAREATRLRRKKKQTTYGTIVLATALATLAYGAFIAVPRYTAEARFSVWGNSGGKSSSVSSRPSLITTGSQPSDGEPLGFVDGYAVNDFLNSRDCMQRLAKRVDLPTMLNKSILDPTAHLPENPSEEQLFAAYQNAISASFNIIEQENVLKVKAFSPEDSQRIAKELLAISQDFIGRMDEQGVNASLDVASAQLKKAQDADLAAATAVAKWHALNRDGDPVADSKTQADTISQINQQLASAQIDYRKITSLGNPTHPLLIPARQRVAALQAQLAEAKGIARGSSQANVEASHFAQLKDAQEFADNNLAAMRANYQNAQTATMRLRRYLAVIAEPVAEDQPSSPNLWLMALEGLLAGVLLAVATSIIMAVSKSYRR
jgi:capsular polysaccharide transport system permease protein